MRQRESEEEEDRRDRRGDTSTFNPISPCSAISPRLERRKDTRTCNGNPRHSSLREEGRHPNLQPHSLLSHLTFFKPFHP